MKITIYRFEFKDKIDGKNPFDAICGELGFINTHKIDSVTFDIDDEYSCVDVELNTDQEFKEGDRVKFIADVERYPHFTVKKGMSGVVTLIDEEMFSVQMNDEIEGAEEWDNNVHFYSSECDFSRLGLYLEKTK